MKEATHCFNEVMFSWIRLFGSIFSSSWNCWTFGAFGAWNGSLLNSVLLGDPTVQPWWANQPFGMETSTFNVVTWIDLLQISRLGWKNTTRLSILHREFECKKDDHDLKSVCVLCQKRWKTPSKKKKTFWKPESGGHDATSTRQLWDAGAKGWGQSIHNSQKQKKTPNQTELMWKINETHGDTSSNGLNVPLSCLFSEWVDSIQNQPTAKNSNSTLRQHFRFSNHWVFDDLQPPSFFIGTSSTRLPPHHPYTAAFMWVPKMTIEAVLGKTRSVDVCHTANGGLISMLTSWA